MPSYGVHRTAGSFAELAAQQCDVLGRAQLFALGVSRNVIRDQIRARRWKPAGRRVVVLHAGPLTDPQRQWAAVLASGPHAALGGITAAARDGLTGFDDSSSIHVLAPHGARPADLAGVVTHLSRRFDPIRDVHPIRLPPRTRPARSVIDAASWVRDDTRTCALVAAAVQQRLVTVPQLREELAAAGLIRRRRLIFEILGDVEGGSESFAELNAVRLFRRAGLPAPSRQAIREDYAGRRRYLDLFWPDHNLCVEIDGAFHRHDREWRLDLERQNDLVAAGVRVLRIPAALLRADPERAVRHVRRILAGS